MFSWGPSKNDVKSGKPRSYGHLAGTIQKVHKIVENAKCRNIKSWLYSTYLASYVKENSAT